MRQFWIEDKIDIIEVIPVGNNIEISKYLNLGERYKNSVLKTGERYKNGD